MCVCLYRCHPLRLLFVVASRTFARSYARRISLNSVFVMRRLNESRSCFAYTRCVYTYSLLMVSLIAILILSLIAGIRWMNKTNEFCCRCFSIYFGICLTFMITHCSRCLCYIEWSTEYDSRIVSMISIRIHWTLW